MARQEMDDDAPRETFDACSGHRGRATVPADFDWFEYAPL
jgi:hypothetical protein